MAENPRAASIPAGGGRPPEDFLGRDEELSRLVRAACFPEGDSPSVIIVDGLPGMGKSELMLQAAAALDREGAVRPVTLSWPAGGAGRPGPVLAAGLIRGARGLPVTGPLPDLGEWAAREKGPAGAALRDVLSLPESAGPDDLAAALGTLAGTLSPEPGRLAVMLDDAPPKAPGGLRRLPPPAPGTGHGAAAWVVAPVRGAGRLPDGAAAGLMLELGPLAPETSGELLALAMSRSGVSFAREARAASAVLGGVPGLIWGAARDARLSGVKEFADASSFLRFAAGRMASGFLDDYHRALFAGSASPAGERAMLEVMLHLAVRRGSPPDDRTIAREMLRERGEIEPVLAALEERGLLRRRWGLWLVSAPPTLADYGRLQTRIHLEGCAPAEAAARLVQENQEALRRRASAGTSRRNALELAGFMASWAGQTLPRTLFDQERFRELFKGRPVPEADAVLAADRGRLVLPRVTAVWPEDFAGDERTPPYGLDLLALAEPGRDGRAKWLAVEVRLEAAEVTEAVVADFERRLRLLQNRAGMRGADLNGWIISGGAFSAEALAAARKHRFWTTTPAQLTLMARMAGYAGTMRLTLPGPPAEEPWVLRMVIPARADTELVAARALEQLSESLPLGEGETGKVKMALVEACLNAFEHGGGEDRNVYLAFRILADRLEIEVMNKGESFIPGRIVKPDIERKMGAEYKRGWGLSIIKELMDELDFVPQERGTLMKMTKYFNIKQAEGKDA